MKEETLLDIGEFECIHRIAHDLIYRPELVKLGTGDDGAVFMLSLIHISEPTRRS